LTAADQLAYNKFLATEAHKRGLLIGLKNDVDQVPVAMGRPCGHFGWLLLPFLPFFELFFPFHSTIFP
jgi:hypothetical protein